MMMMQVMKVLLGLGTRAVEGGRCVEVGTGRVSSGAVSLSHTFFALVLVLTD
jgi:hypothetical protein